MVRRLVFAAIIALVAIYSRETFAKTLVNPSIAEPAIAKHTKDIDDDNRSAARSHHRGGRSPSGDDLSDSEDSGDVGPSGGGDSRGHHWSSSAGTASGGDGVQIGVDGQTTFSRSQISQLESTFANKQYLSPLERKRLAGSLGLEQRQVQTWFYRRRVKVGIRSGTNFSGSQRSQLESTFANKQYLSPLECKRLAGSIGLEERQVRTWFINRRCKAKTQARRTTFSESQISQSQRAVDRENDTSPSERASPAAPPDLTELQAQGWFDNCRREEPPAATFNPAHMALALHTNLLLSMFHHYAAAVLGQFGNGNGDPVASSVASSSVSGVLPHSVDDGTYGWSVPTDGMFHSHHPQHQYHGQPSHVHADRMLTHQEYPESPSPTSSPSYPQPRRYSSE